MRIHVTGNAGSGKSTLAKEISDALDIPYFGLDKIVWQQHWQVTPKAQRQNAEQRLTEQRDWVIDGVSRQARLAADIIVFIDRPATQCALRAFRRNLPYLFRSRPGLPPNCPEIKIAPALLKLIYGFNKRTRPSILDDLAGKSSYIVRSDRDVQLFTTELSQSLALDP